jgi:ABC-type dipeptide/oligopeptide/nickel transport system ATPase component
MSEKEILSLRGKRIAMIFQDPLTSLNPLFSIGDQFVESILTHEKGISKKEALKANLLNEVLCLKPIFTLKGVIV